MINTQKIPIKKLLFVFLGLFIVGLAINFVWYGTVTVTNSKTRAEVVVGSVIIKPGQSQRIRPGNYEVAIRGKRISKETLKLTVIPFSKKTISIDQKDLTDVQLAAKISGIPEDQIKLNGMRFFENETWMIATITTIDNPSDAGTVIAKYVSGEWVVVDDGTGFDISESLAIPASIKNYFSESRER